MFQFLRVSAPPVLVRGHFGHDPLPGKAVASGSVRPSLRVPCHCLCWWTSSDFKNTETCLQSSFVQLRPHVSAVSWGVHQDGNSASPADSYFTALQGVRRALHTDARARGSNEVTLLGSACWLTALLRQLVDVIVACAVMAVITSCNYLYIYICISLIVITS
jgi:hypothetical protein